VQDAAFDDDWIVVGSGSARVGVGHHRRMIDSTGPGLAERLKQGTSAVHRQAERSGVMAELLQGRIGAGAYGRLLRNLHALDRHRGDPVIGFTAALELQRADRLAADLAQLFPARHEPSALVPATRAYVERLQTLADREPVRLVAHAYVRYLGDLHGGQLLGRIVRQRFAIAGDAGTRFYDFGDEAQVLQRRLAFRRALGALPVTPPECDAIVAEAVDAFARHVQLFEELGVSR
jgi:heme oxygenase (biliverdin-producing, ferredoxin)